MLVQLGTLLESMDYMGLSDNWPSKWYIIWLCLALVLARMHHLVATGLNNIASHYLVSEWRPVSQSLGIPICQRVLQASLAKSYLQKALYLYPSYQRAWLNMGRVAWLEGNCKSARDAWERALVITPEDSIAAWWALWSAGGPKNKIASYLESEVIGRYAYQAGLRAEEAEDIKDALTWYRIAFKMTPSRVIAQRMSVLHRRSGQLDQTIAIWKDLAAPLSRDEADYWWAVGEIAMLEQDWECAADAFGTGALLSNDPYDFLMRQGQAFYQIQDWDKAETAFRKAMALRPEWLGPYLGIGNIRRAQNDYIGALYWYQRAAELDPNSYDPVYCLGLVYYSQKEFSLAAEHFARSLTLYPKHSWSAYYLALCLHEMGEKASAVTILSHAIDIYPGKPWDWAELLGDWQVDLGNRDAALQAYQLALKWYPEANKKKLLEKIEKLSSK